MRQRNQQLKENDDIKNIPGLKPHLQLCVKMFCFFNCLSLHLFHRYLHPEGLPSDYTISMMFRLLPETPQEPFALWEILNRENDPLVGLMLNSES